MGRQRDGRGWRLVLLIGTFVTIDHLAFATIDHLAFATIDHLLATIDTSSRSRSTPPRDGRRCPVDATEDPEPLVVLVGGGPAFDQDRAADAPARGQRAVSSVVGEPQLVPSGLATAWTSALGGEVDETSGQGLGGSHSDSHRLTVTSAARAVTGPCMVLGTESM